MKNNTFPTFHQALKIVLSSALKMKTERVSLMQAYGRVLAEDIVSDADMPPCNLSTMDGFACRRQDLCMELSVIETIPAGKIPIKTVTKGTCSRIMTGAPVPCGADTVVMLEDTVFNNTAGTITVIRKQNSSNIRYCAEDVIKGTIVLRKGAIVNAPDIAVLASIGKVSVCVAKKPRVGILTTGDELVEPLCKPSWGQRRNCNSYQLQALVHDAGGEGAYFGIVKDDPGELDAALARALPECDVVLISGGVSTGDFDYVPAVLKKKRIKLLFEKIAVKPGKPTVFGIAGKKRFFGIPGNPVSTFVIFQMLVRPFLYAMTGHRDARIAVPLRLSADITRKSIDRLEFLPVKITGKGTVKPIEYHGSAHIHAYTSADGIIAVPSGMETITSGTIVQVTLLR